MDLGTLFSLEAFSLGLAGNVGVVRILVNHPADSVHDLSTKEWRLALILRGRFWGRLFPRRRGGSAKACQLARRHFRIIFHLEMD